MSRFVLYCGRLQAGTSDFDSAVAVGRIWASAGRSVVIVDNLALPASPCRWLLTDAYFGAISFAPGVRGNPGPDA
jgi:hypothetical protein